MIDVARRLCQDLQIPVAEMWAYSLLGDQLRFTMVQRSAQAPEVKTRPAAATPRAAAAPARKAGNGQARAAAVRTVAGNRGKAKVAAKKAARPAAPARGAVSARKSVRASARPVPKKSSSASRAKRK
jgi:hypothetical protein